MDHDGAKWLIATLVFLGALILGMSGGGSKGHSSPPAPPSVATPDPTAAEQPACPRPRRGVWTGGKPDARKVALTFDDGPSAQTDTILRALRRHHAHATFFLIGQQIPGHRSVLRRAVRDGNELGNHSTSHTSLPGYEDIRKTSRTIKRATGAPPCLFRPPLGDTSDRLLRDVRKLGMTTTAWDVDTGDWADQSPFDIRARALANVHPGAIILMHDGGGDRSGTARAVSGVVHGLRAHGYSVVTVSELFPDR
jgi:peptidoglycan/xylan/chitin deacetylase (PgdA/CDA1 family)